ncbi:MAG TPA: DUF3298 and DUF4163 domain-containing protein [Pyrinomonadaceae bacterium]|nr:DUF3298 and DUF4163 domain-containing protein [Pyrinomonadaceae bacterium]
MRIKKLSKLILVIGLLGTNMACSQVVKESNVNAKNTIQVQTNKNTVVNQTTSNSIPNVTEEDQTEKFNKFFSGSIGDETGENAKVFPFQMRLQRNGKQLSGKYRYTSSKSDILLNGTIDDQNKFVLSESVDGKNTGKFEGSLENDGEDGLKMSGTWTKAGTEDFVGFSADEIALEMSGDVYFQNQTIKEKTNGNDISISYPQFVGGNFTALNLALKNIALQYQNEFKKGKPEKGEENYLESGYTIEFANDNIVSVQFGQESFSGGAHPNHSSQTLNFDLKNNKPIKLADLFKPNSKYLQKLSQLSKEGLGDNLQFEEGIAPVAKNFSDFLITKKGLLILFDEYQVAPYAAGPQEVLISYADLKEFLIKNEIYGIH